MKRILFIATSNIHKKDGGGIEQKGKYNSLICLFPDKVDLMMAEECMSEDDTNAIGVPRRSLFKAVMSGSIHRNKEFLRNYLVTNHDKYSLIVISGGVAAGDMIDMIHNFGIKIMVIHLNFEREYHMDNRTLLTLGGRIPYFIIKNERTAYLRCDCNCFMSVDDKLLFEQYYGPTNVPSVVVGAYEPEDKIMGPIENTKAVHKTIVITGSMDTVQTIEGIKDFRKNYFQIFKDMYPDWNLVLAGRNPAADIYDFANTAREVIDIIPNPNSMEEIIKSSSIFLCPTNVGGGIKLRVMDGLRFGRPVLVHEVSARGYESMCNEPYFRVYHDRNSFILGLSDIMTYLQHQNEPNEIRSKYLEYFSFEAGTQRLATAIDLM